MTFLTLQTRVGELINQAVTDDTKTVTLTEVKANLNIGYTKLVSAVVAVNEDFYLTSAKANLVASQELYALPVDSNGRCNCRKLKRLEIGYESSSTRRLAVKLDRDFKGDPTAVYSTGSPAYYIIGNQIELDPTPSSNVTEGLKFYYVKSPVDMSANGDYPDLPSGYEWVPLLYAAAKGKQRLGLLTEASDLLMEFKGEIETMKDELLMRAIDQPGFVKYNGDYGDSLI